MTYIPITARKCGYCYTGPTQAAGPLSPALGTGESYHAGCVDRAEARITAGLPPIVALDPAGDDIPDGIGFDGQPGDLYGPGE
jgi:hypothetical protein